MRLRNKVKVDLFAKFKLCPSKTLDNQKDFNLKL